MKKCNHYLEHKDLHEFSRDRRYENGRINTCKLCIKKRRIRLSDKMFDIKGTIEFWYVGMLIGNYHYRYKSQRTFIIKKFFSQHPNHNHPIEMIIKPIVK